MSGPTYLLNRTLQIGEGSEILQGGRTVVGSDGQITGTPYTEIISVTPDTTAVFANQFTETSAGSGVYAVAQAGGATVPTDGETGFSLGALFSDGLTQTAYLNTGDSTSCAFRRIELGQSTRSGAGAIPTNRRTCLLTTTGADALTLADGYVGQRLTIIMVVDGGNGTLTPTTANGFTTATFGDVADSLTLEWVPTLGWTAVSNVGVVLA